MSTAPDRQRIDKWLWAARFYKTRALAVDEIALGRVTVNGQSVKPNANGQMRQGWQKLFVRPCFPIRW